MISFVAGFVASPSRDLPDHVFRRPRMSGTVPDIVAELYRRHYSELLAPLIRVLRSFEQAEDVLQESFAHAVDRWSADELPDEPIAWLKRVSKNKAIDQYRRNASWRSKEKVLASISPDSVEFDFDGEPIGDDLLRLIFTCCHPSLSPEAQIALTLRTVCGLTSDEVARAFLIKPTTLQQRIVRAKRKIDSAKIPYVVPDRESLPGSYRDRAPDDLPGVQRGIRGNRRFRSGSARTV